MSGWISRTRIITVCTFSFVPCKIRWDVRNRNSALLPLRITARRLKDTDIFPTSKINRAPKEHESLIIVTGLHFKDAYMTRAMIMALFLASFDVVIMHIAISSNLCGSAHRSFLHLMLHDINIAFQSSAFPGSIQLPTSLKPDHGATRMRFFFSSLLSIHRCSVLILLHLCRLVFPHHSIRTTLPWIVLGKLSCISWSGILPWSTRLLCPLMFELLSHSVLFWCVGPHLCFVLNIRKSGTMGRWVPLFKMRAIKTRSWKEHKISQMKDTAIGIVVKNNCWNFVNLNQCWALKWIMDKKKVDKSLISVACSMHCTCKLIKLNLETSVVVFGFRVL